MKYILRTILIASAAAAFAACGAPANNAPANAPANTNSNTKPATAAAPTKESLMAIEKSGWEAWKNKDSKWFEDNLSPKYVGFNKTGRVDKAGSIKAMGEQKCEVKDYSFSDEQLNMIGADVAVVSFKATQDYTCDGKKGDSPTWSASVYMREGDKWKNVMYVENAAVDPNAPPKPAAKPAPAKPGAPASDKKDAAKPAGDDKPAAADDLLAALMAVEKTGWDAWKSRDAKAMDGVLGKDYLYVGATGRYDRAAVLKYWSEPKCTALDYKFSEPATVGIAPDVALITYKADVKGTCDGAPVPPQLWVASFDINEGHNTWKNAFYTDVPR